MTRFTDITVDGSITLGASITALLMVNGWSPWMAAFIAFMAGGAAGMVTGLLHTRFRIQEILCGILMMTALYSINLRIMGRSNIPLLSVKSYSGGMEKLLSGMTDSAAKINIAGWMVPVADIAFFITTALITILTGIVLYRFLLTHYGTALRAAGSNAQMVRAQGINHYTMIITGLGLSNGLVALSGSLLAQYQGFADVQMGIGMMVWGLASIIIGEALAGRSGIGIMITGTILGTILFRLLIAIALRWGLNPNDLKLVTAIFVFAALVAPQWFRSILKKMSKGVHHAEN
jgi:putative ABC transport system permease protein